MVIAMYLFFTVLGLILLKLGSNSVNIITGNGNFGVSMNYISILGFIAYIISFVLYTFFVIKKYDLSYIYPIVTGLTQILVVAAGIFIFKENINIQGIIGIILIIIGLVLLNIR